jgi:hypothetical protein
MIFNYVPFIPYFPITHEEPPTIYAILNSYVNFGKSEDEKVKSYDLAKVGKEVIFDFDYPLSENVDKNKFEELILNKFLMRRIGFETVNAFKIQLNVKLNEIMPKYNKLFDISENWNIFDGETYERTYNESRNDNGSSTNNMSTTTSDTSDRRYSNVPQNEIDDIKDGSYMTDYNYDENASNTSSNNNSSSVTTGNTNTHEITTRTLGDKFKTYQEYLDMQDSIYTRIFKDLEILFYGIV